MSKMLGRFVLMLLGALGLTGCGTLGPDPVEYGCPYADYRLSGIVVDTDSSKAIAGIEIRFCDLTAYTDIAGKWSIEGRTSCAPRERDSLQVADIDGDANRGTFLPDSVKVDLTKVTSPIEIFDEWYLGSFEQSDILITLEKTP